MGSYSCRGHWSAAVASVLLAFSLAFFNTTQANPSLTLKKGDPGVGDRTSMAHPVKGPLVDQHGRIFSFKKRPTKLTVMNFSFTTCSSICPVQTAALAGIYRQLSASAQAKVSLVSVSVDPMNDTPQALAAYAVKMKVNQLPWTFVTGGTQTVANLIEFYSGWRLSTNKNPWLGPQSAPLPVKTKPSLQKPDNHTATLYLMNSSGQVIQKYDGFPVNSERLVREIEQVAKLPEIRFVR